MLPFFIDSQAGYVLQWLMSWYFAGAETTRGMARVKDDLRTELHARLKGKRFGIVGIGNVIKGDDGAGSDSSYQ